MNHPPLISLLGGWRGIFYYLYSGVDDLITRELKPYVVEVNSANE